MTARPPKRPSADDTAAWRPDPDGDTSLLFDVFVLGQRARALVDDAMRDAGLRPDEYAAYSVVFEQGSVTLTAMAVRLAMPLTTVAEYVGGMVSRGHARKSADPADRRARLIALTPAGIRAHRRASRSFERAHQALLGELGPSEEAATREVVQRLAGSIERAHRAIPVTRTG